MPDGTTPLLSASLNGHKDLVQLLIDRGADINAALIDQNTSLDLASERLHLNVVETLVKAGARNQRTLQQQIDSLRENPNAPRFNEKKSVVKWQLVAEYNPQTVVNPWPAELASLPTEALQLQSDHLENSLQTVARHLCLEFFRTLEALPGKENLPEGNVLKEHPVFEKFLPIYREVPPELQCEIVKSLVTQIFSEGRSQTMADPNEPWWPAAAAKNWKVLLPRLAHFNPEVQNRVKRSWEEEVNRFRGSPKPFDDDEFDLDLLTKSKPPSWMHR